MRREAPYTPKETAAMKAVRLELAPHQQDLFWAKVDQTGDCWEWTASRGPAGYGQFMIKGDDGKWRVRRAHRIAYTLTKGEIPDELVIDHLCHKKSCVNPSHLRATTPKRNNENRKGANRNGKSGVRGVCWDKQQQKWVVQVGHAGRIYRGGFFKDLRMAEASAIELRARLYAGVAA